MAIGLYFSPQQLSPGQYDKIVAQLEEAGAGRPEGRSHHSAFLVDGNIHVFEIWDSQAHFDAFGATLMPILAQAGVDPGTPHASPVHNVIAG